MQRSKSCGIYATCKAISSLQLIGFLAISAIAAPKPNIIVMLIDDMGVHDGEPFDSRYFKTPQMTRFANEGVKFTQAYAASAVCSPTRAALMTGKNPARLHLTDYIPGENDSKNALLKIPDWQKSLPKDEVTLAEALKQCGYRTASIGKWHLGGTGSFPEDHGFDVNIAGAAAGHPASYFWPYEKGNDTHAGTGKGGGIATLKQGGKDGEYLTDRLTDEAIQFIETSKGQPFFLYLPHYAVHSPLMGKKDLVGEARQVPPANGQENAIYHAMITSVDQSLGRILDTLEKLKLSDHTIVIFTSDNGGVIHAGKPPATCNAPQRLGKGYAYEGGLRVPLIIKAPGHTKPGSTSAVPVITQDFFPTLLAMANPRGEVKCPTLDGMNILPALKGDEKPIHDQLCWHYPHYWGGGKVTPYSVIRRGDMKLIRFWETGKEELYDLAKDPSETTDLAANQPGLRADLAARLDAWLRENHAQIPQRK